MKRYWRTAALAAFGGSLAVVGLTAIRGRTEAQDGLPRLETQIYGQSTWIAGSPASLRIVARNHANGDPVSGARVEVSLERLGERESGGKGEPGAKESPTRPLSHSPIPLFKGQTNKEGTVDAAFGVPEWPQGSYRLVVKVAALNEKDEVTRTVTLRAGEQVLLTTDKPLYQPGQTIHVRALALRQPDQRPYANAPATLEVEDAKGNKVFKKRANTSRHGILAADFVLASEVNQGRYTVRAVMGETRQEKTVTVERYVLPKFKVSLAPERKFYLPGQEMAGTVRSDYFFGKPVARAKVVVTLSKFDAGFQQFARIEGQTDDAGAFAFRQALPAHFVGQPLEQGNAFVKYDVEVTDGANHTEKVSGMVPVAGQPIKITVVPESGRVVPELENTFYILTTYPDGSPAKTQVTISLTGERLADRIATDETGIAEWRILPRQPQVTLRVVASDAQGNRAESNVSVTGRYQPGSLILRADRALYTAGDTMRLTVLAPAGRGTVYVDLVRAGQTVLTRSATLRGGTVTLPITLTPDLAGTLQAHAYRIQPDGQIVRDTRVVFVDAGTSLKIDVRPDKDVYLPGSPAKLTFQLSAVTPSPGHPVTPSRLFPAALGVSIVDESVFALQEMQPGMEKVYFLLEKEILEPKFEIHGITPDKIVEPASVRDAGRQRAATILFASLPRNDQFSLTANSYEEKVQRLQEQWEKQVAADASRIARAVEAYRKRGGAVSDNMTTQVLVQAGLLTDKEAKDPFGRYYRLQGEGRAVLSNGPDGKPDTEDDLVAYVGPDGKPLAVPRRRMFKGRVGAVPEMAMDLAVMRRMAAAAAPAGEARLEAAAGGGAGAGAGGAAPEVRVRQWFPETLLFQPALITDERGRATLEVPSVADSITTWRLTAMGSSPAGLLGSVTAPLRVFQDFFVDIDFPVSLTQNDEVAVPVAVYNYLQARQSVRLAVEREPWFELLEDAEKTLEIGANDVRGASFRVKVKGIGFHKLTLRAYGTKMNDAVRREVEVVPDGRRVEFSASDRLEGTVRRTVEIPEGAIAGASNILVKIYPGFLSQAVEGMDKILQMPFGCFEQTSSTTYPNILVLDYMRASNKVTPETQMKAEQYINLGYQRLLTFEVAGGGFSWFGDAPANRILTAYGLMEFQDMAAVHEVDPALIERTREWLLSQQQPDGTWKPDAAYLHEESWGRIQHNELLPTAFITWALLERGRGGEGPAPGSPIQRDPRLMKAAAYLAKHRGDSKEAYTLGIVANALAAAGRPEANDVLGELLERAQEKDGALWWESKQATVTFSHGDAANLEATALIGYALVRSGRYPNQANKVITYLVRTRDPQGTWFSTQATVLALKTLLAAQKGAAEGVDARVRVRINGEDAGAFRITRDNADVMQQADLKRFVRAGKNEVEIAFDGKGSSLFQVSAYHYLPWKTAGPAEGAGKAMEIQVAYDRTELEKEDTLTADVRVAYNGPGAAANMVMVDLGIPPGFDVLTEDLNELVGSKVIQKFQTTPRQVILYLEKLEKGKPLSFRYRMKARFPLRAKTAASTAYLYYNPEVRATAPPVEVTVR